MFIVRMKPFPKVIISGKNWIYEARVWNMIIISAIVGFLIGVIL